MWPSSLASGAEVVVDLRARAAGSGVAHLPEVVLFVQPDDAIARNCRCLWPRVPAASSSSRNTVTQSFSTGSLNSFVSSVPGVVDGFLLEVVAEREVAEHFEECLMAARVADVIEIVVLAAGPDAFLSTCRRAVGALFASQEDILELIHSGIDEEQRGILGRNQRGTFDDRVATVFKKFEKRRRISLLFMKLFQFLSYGVLWISKTAQSPKKTSGIASVEAEARNFQSVILAFSAS